MTLEGPLPEQSESQRIGHLAGKCFIANCPNEWLWNDLSGTDDFGFDYQVQLVQARRLSAAFRLQLKGTVAPQRNASDEFFSIQLKASTVRYYDRATDPILFVMADLSVDPNRPANCALYSCWIHDELRRLNEQGLPPEQQYVTLKVPVANKLTTSTDVSAELHRYRTLAKVGDALDVVAERIYPSLAPTARADLVERIPRTIARSSPALLQSLVDETVAHWPEAPKGSFAWYLQEATQKLRGGKGDEAAQSLADAAALASPVTNLEWAEHWSLKGKLHGFRLDDVAARDAFAKAAELSNDAPKYVAAWAETELRIRFLLNGGADFSDVLARLSSSDPQIQNIRSRLLAASHHFDEAAQVAKQIAGIEKWVALAVIYTMQSKYDLALDAINSGLREPHIRDGTKQLFQIMSARAYFGLGVGPLDTNESEVSFPPSGPAGANLDLLKKAWNCIEIAIESLRAAGWPANVELLVDIWVATALILDKKADVLPILTHAANARPTLVMLQTGLETLAVQTGDFERALLANTRLPDSDTKTLRRVTFLHLSHKDTECVNLFEEKGLRAITQEMFGFALVQAILSADRIVRPDLVATWRLVLDNSIQLTEHRASLDYFLATSKNLLAKDSALVKLEVQYHALGAPLSIAMHLFHELDASIKDQAQKCVEIAKRIARDRMLPSEAALHLAQALATLGRWTELHDLTVNALLRFESSHRFLAIQAMAQDRLGHSAEAAASLKALITSGSTDKFALNTYINIVVRCGFTDDAIRSVEKVLANETDTSRQIEALQLLFNLVQHRDPLNSRGIDIAWRLGQIVKRDDENQEGLFLLLMLAATLHVETSTSDARIPEFQERLKTFTEKFPDSKLLKSCQFPENASAREMLQMLQRISGVNDAQLKLREKLEREMQRGEVPIQYAWRPRQVLGSVPDVPTLWEIAKLSKPHERQFHLVMALETWKQTPVFEMEKRVPLLDLITLLLVKDLEVFDLLFKVFPKIAIGQATLLELAQFLSPMAGSPMRQKCFELQETLKTHFEQIVQPRAPMPDQSAAVERRWPSEEIKVLAKSGEFNLYSDDAIFCIYCDATSSGTIRICTLDFLGELERKGLLSTSEVSQKYARMCAWHIGLFIDLKYQIAILPDELGSAKSVSDGIDILRTSADASAIFNEIWDPRRPYDQLVGHGAGIFRAFVENRQNKIESIAAVLGIWFTKAKLRTDAPHPSLRVLVQVLLSAASSEAKLSEESSRRLWSAFNSLVAIEYGEYMDEAKEKEAISLVGEMIAGLHNRSNPVGTETLYARLVKGLTDGTSESEAFRKGFDKQLDALVERALRP